ncbi:phenylacetic acid degradation operon negative regulatory protein PaaX [Mangrovitalea sediminis]|uniref:phenylacetic acid degradation operon negative regulatory protein PaaX n=1 Tax=Mangrovitalea sediminis TaxID=1982043 RepID=UPI000BE5FBAC|nr:phenylacetic acid degradation operon negative regulatory protein PaaX [Mangrovitalea sediminis]
MKRAKTESVLPTGHLGELIERFQSQRPLRTGSLIITIYGDAIAPRGGTVWLGSLIQLLETFGISQRLVRTSVFRLVREGWLLTDKVGRRSYYSLTASGRRRFEQAFKRVYAASQPDWEGAWTMAILNQVSVERRKSVRDELEWMGFGAFAPTIMAHPTVDKSDVVTQLQDMNVLDDVILLDTTAQERFASRPLRLLVREAWNLDQLSASYQDFLEQFRPLWNEMRTRDALDPEECFLARILLIHEYRKVLLRDPLLPEELLPSDWEGRAARQLCRNLYRLTCDGAEQWMSEQLETAEGPLPAPHPGFHKRFGGLA